MFLMIRVEDLPANVSVQDVVDRIRESLNEFGLADWQVGSINAVDRGKLASDPPNAHVTWKRNDA